MSNIICSLVFGQRFSYKDTHFLRLLQIISGVLQFGSSSLGQVCDDTDVQNIVELRNIMLESSFFSQTPDLPYLSKTVQAKGLLLRVETQINDIHILYIYIMVQVFMI